MDIPAFNDPKVQTVYRILCDCTLVPPPEEHWEGFLARHIIAALRTDTAQKQLKPTETDMNKAGADGV